MKEVTEAIPLSRKIQVTNRLGHDMSGRVRISKDMLNAWEHDASSLELRNGLLAEQLRARNAIDGWLAQFDGDDDVSYSVTEHPDTGLRNYAVFQYGNKATFTDQDWYQSPAALADALGLDWRSP